MATESVDDRSQTSSPRPSQDGQSEELLGALLGSVNELVWCTTADGSRLLFLNAAAERIYGRPLDEMRSNPDVWLEAVHADDRATVESNLGNLLKLGQIQQEYRIVRPDGQIRWLQDRISVICDKAGAPQHVGGIATDITEQKLAELSLQESAVLPDGEAAA